MHPGFGMHKSVPYARKKWRGKHLKNKVLIAMVVCLVMTALLAFPVSAETEYAAKVGDTGYATVAQAVAAANGETVTLLADSAETVTVSGDLYLDLNGHTLAGLTVENGTLYGMDCTTDDYDCCDAVFLTYFSNNCELFFCF